MLADPDGAVVPLKPLASVSVAVPAAAATDRVPASQKIGYGLGSFLDMLTADCERWISGAAADSDPLSTTETNARNQSSCRSAADTASP